MTPSLTTRAFTIATQLLPNDFREEYGADMEAMFADRMRDARRRGRLNHAGRAALEIAAVVRVAIVERYRRPQAARLANIGWPETIAYETRHAVRRLRRTPAFSAMAILTLALAIGANSAVFTLLNRIVLADFPYPNADRVVALDHLAPRAGLQSGMGMSIGVYREYATLRSIDAIAIYNTAEATLTGADGAGTAERVSYLFTTPSLGGILGITTSAGRWFDEADGIAGSPNVVVLTDALWQTRFGGSPTVVGSTLRLAGTVYEIIGVLSPDVVFSDQATQLVIPLPLPRVWSRASGFNYRGIARLAAGVSIDDAEREQQAVIKDLAARYPDDPEARAGVIGAGQLVPRVEPFKQSIVGDTTTTLWVLLGAVIVLLVVACANLANLFLARTESRHKDVALRCALGATPRSVGAYFLCESLVVALASGIVGLGIAFLSVRALVSGAPVPLPRLQEVRIDAVAITFTAVTSVVSGLGFGLLCLVRYSTSRSSPLRVAERSGTTSSTRARARQVLMGAQVALAVVLLAAAGLMVKSFANLLRVDPGFDSQSRLVFRVGLPRSEYRTRPEAARFHAEALARLAALPGVQRAAVTTTLPLDGQGLGNPIEVLGGPARPADANPIVRLRRISDDYVSTMNIRMVDGRIPSDAAAGGEVAVNQALARAYFDSQNPIGRQIRQIGEAGQSWLTIVGVVSNTVTESLQESEPTPQVYIALRDSTRGNLPGPHDVAYVLKVNGVPSALVPAVRSVLRELDPGVPMWRPEPLADIVERSRATLSFTLVLLVTAAVVALVLGIVGVYAVIAYSVAQRSREIGVRLALGALPGQVTGMIVRESVGVILAGVTAGVVVALAGSRLLRALLFGVTPNDAITYAVAGVLLASIATVAAWLPARRAARLAPFEALRLG